MKPPGPDDPASAATAWANGRQTGPKARYWLERALRLAPEDPRIALDLAQSLLTGTKTELARAIELLEPLSARWDIAASWLGLALAFDKQGNSTQAAAALHKLLIRHCQAEDAGFSAFAAHVARAAGYGGFQALSPDGRSIRRGKGRLLGASPDQAALMRVEGLASWISTGISGWACRPAWPDTPPELTLHDAAGQTRRVRFGPPLPPDDDAPFLPRHRFRIPPRALRGLIPPFCLRGPDGCDIMGSPLDPRPLQAAPIPVAAMPAPPPGRIPPRAPLTLIMPVYAGMAETKAALASVLDAAPRRARLIVVDDATPEPGLARWLDQLAAQKRITLLRHERNLGFCAAVNTGLAVAHGRDVLLLNSDILLPPGAVETLRDVAYAHAATGTVTPLSNEATICSYPNPEGGNPMPDLAATCHLQNLARATNKRAAVKIPTGVGFCLYLRHDCLAATGKLRGEIFAQGYGEENDFCLRARALGFQHMAAMGAYVAHRGGVSFRVATRGLTMRNLALLNQLHPGYHELVMAHMAADPLRPYRQALDAARLREECAGREALLLISHSHGGGVARQVTADMEALRTQGLAPLLLATAFPKNPAKTPYPWPAQLSAGDPCAYPNLSFTLPGAMPALLALLRDLQVARVVRHHMLGQHESLRDLARLLDVPLDLVVHDYASFCPRVNLLNRATPDSPLRYCGEPDEASCRRCCARDRAGVHERLTVRQLRTRSAQEFAAAATVTVPSIDAARRLKRHFPSLRPVVRAWEDDSAPKRLIPPRQTRRRVAVIGGIGPAKGFDLLLDCAIDAQTRRLPLEFCVIGGSADDARLLQAGIFVTGHYQEGEAGPLIASLAPDLAFLPSIWPETWCFALSEAWNAGLVSVVFDLGAQAERIRATGRGLVLPLGLPAARINDHLLRI